MRDFKNTALLGAAWALSSVTAITVALAVYALLDDKRLAVLFAGAFVVLDLVKYALWPVARDCIAGGRRLAGIALIACAVSLASVSGWATSDLLTGALSARAVKLEAQQHRIADLEAARTDARTALDALAAEAAAARQQADVLRARGMATPALNLENATHARLEARRADAQARLDAAAAELAGLRAEPLPAAMPVTLATLLGLGLALALEVVPALLLTVIRSEPAPAPAEPAVAEAQSQRALEPETLETATPEPENASEDARLLVDLLASASETPAGEPVRLKEFARSKRIGNLRAANLFRTAADLGAIRKTSTGYVAA